MPAFAGMTAFGHCMSQQLWREDQKFLVTRVSMTERSEV
jgi:hypothetical protein